MDPGSEGEEEEEEEERTWVLGVSWLGVCFTSRLFKKNKYIVDNVHEHVPHSTHDDSQPPLPIPRK